MSWQKINGSVYDVTNLRTHPLTHEWGTRFMTKEELDKLVELFRLVENRAAGHPITITELKPYLNEHITVESVKKGRHIIKAYESLTDMILVAKGEFYLTRDSRSGMSSMVSRIWAPDFLGIPQLVSEDKLYYSNIIASENCLLLHIDSGYFDEGMHMSAEIGIHCINSMCRALQRNHKQMERIFFFDATENLMGYLYRKWIEAGATQQLLCVREKHTIIANELSVTVRTVCRALNKLKDQDMLSTDARGYIHVTPEQMLKIQKAYN